MSRRVRRLGFALAVVACAALIVLHALAWAGSHGWTGALAGLAGIALGMLAADLTTGAVHWACDTFGDERTPWLGPLLIRSFREHHRAPLAMLSHDWREVNGEACTAGALALAALRLPPFPQLLGEHALLHAFLVAWIGVAAVANQLHQWAHDPQPPHAARWLQRGGLVLSRARHARHHRAPHRRAYCISSGWLDGALDRSGFWRTLERIVARLTRATPSRYGPTRRDAHPHPEKR